jgi:regulator of replication initiation timing
MINTVSERTDGLEFQCGELDDRLTQLASENQSLKMEITDLKARSMRDNLVFSNIPERPDETPNVTEDILRDFLERELKMARTEVNNISFERVHRMAGRNNPRASAVSNKGRT